MEIIEKQVEKVKEVPYGYGYYDGYGRNVVGKANAGLALGIVGTVLGGAALFGNRRNGLLGVGSNGDGANIAIASCGYAGGNNVAPTAFQAWEKECEDTFKNFGKITKALDLIADENGNVDIEGILSEMMDNLMTTQPFTIKTSFIGDVEIGGGNIKLNIPLTDKRLVFNMSDLENFKEMLITKD